MAAKKSVLKDKVDTEDTLFLVDVSSFIFRAFFAIRALNNTKGEPTNAVYGVATMLARLLEDAKPSHLFITYDSKGPSFREEIYPEYKANRSDPPEDLIPQFERIDQLISAMEMPSVRQTGVEADDLIATLCKSWKAKSKKHKVVVVTGDKDLMQLVDDRTWVWDTMKDKLYDPLDVTEKFGVPANQVLDYLAMVGDTSDNIPGVPSIGPKSACTLLEEFKTLDGVLQAAADGKIKGKKGSVLVEYKEQALLSRQLAKLKDDVKVDVDPASVHYNFAVTPKIKDLLKDLEFHTLIERWGKVFGEAEEDGTGQKTISKQSTAKDRFEAIFSEKDLEKVLSEIKKVGEFSIDLETTSLDARVAEIVGIALSVDEEIGYYIPLKHRTSDPKQLDHDWVLEKMKPLLLDPRVKKIGQNLKYDWSIFYNHGIEMDGIGADTMVAAYVLDPAGRHNFDTLCLKYLDYQPVKYEDVCGSGKSQIGFDQVPVSDATRYAAEDALYTLKLWKVLKKRLYEDKLIDVFAQVDLPLVKVLAEMECEGVCIDSEWLKKLSRQFDKELLEIQQKVEKIKKGPINLNSPKQIGVLLFEDLKLPTKSKTKTGYSTDARVLEQLSDLHEVPAMLLQHREIAKLKGTYIDPLPTMVSPKTKRIHAGFHQTVAATGRLSSSDPNLQNIPIRTERGQMIRRAFIPSEGNLLLSADYSQIELRILAHLSGDKELIRSFNDDEDVHQRTASEIFDIDPEKVDSRQRGIAKAINFGLMYGKTPYGLSQELKIPMADAKEMISQYFKRYSAVKEFLDEKIEFARENGYALTLMGRRRFLPDIKSRNPAIRNNAERMAMNTPIQGTAADMIKIAMLRLSERLGEKEYQSKLVIQVHDELVMDCVEKEVEQMKSIVTTSMEGAMELKVPLKVNLAVGKNWQELK